MYRISHISLATKDISHDFVQQRDIEVTEKGKLYG